MNRIPCCSIMCYVPILPIPSRNQVINIVDYSGHVTERRDSVSLSKTPFSNDRNSL